MRKKVAKVGDGPVPRDTFAQLDELLQRLLEEGAEGEWVKMWRYDRGGSADSLAHDIRHGKVKLPDEDGNEGGVWSARVQRINKGRGGKAGPAWVYVKYEGRGDG